MKDFKILYNVLTTKNMSTIAQLGKLNAIRNDDEITSKPSARKRKRSETNKPETNHSVYDFFPQTDFEEVPLQLAIARDVLKNDNIIIETGMHELLFTSENSAENPQGAQSLPQGKQGQGSKKLKLMAANGDETLTRKEKLKHFYFPSRVPAPIKSTINIKDCKIFIEKQNSVRSKIQIDLYKNYAYPVCKKSLLPKYIKQQVHHAERVAYIIGTLKSSEHRTKIGSEEEIVGNTGSTNSMNPVGKFILLGFCLIYDEDTTVEDKISPSDEAFSNFMLKSKLVVKQKLFSNNPKIAYIDILCSSFNVGANLVNAVEKYYANKGYDGLALSAVSSQKTDPYGWYINKLKFMIHDIYMDLTYPILYNYTVIDNEPKSVPMAYKVFKRDSMQAGFLLVKPLKRVTKDAISIKVLSEDDSAKLMKKWHAHSTLGKVIKSSLFKNLSPTELSIT